ncbi:TPR-like protein [Xylaria bambusicola]|uniref:TPR-like protein n=1 Tax=Xylaria bambusicola TaxID=326684 RepID=UPI002008819A|nr:TPR-like protein [Xylaria bambusicola]KAI0516723.1 TPR-like protein [Xylaria bambusicola]
MHIQKISDEVAERLKIEQSQPQSETSTSIPAATSIEESQDGSASAPLTTAMFPELSPGRAMTGKKTVDEVVAELKKSPFFMTELEENDETEALKALAYEGTPLENASEFKEQGNECFKAKRWADAKEFYTKGVLILAAEERKRKQAAENPASRVSSKEMSKEKGEETSDEKENKETSEEEIQKERATLESLYVNRAACHLELKNYRSCWLDASAALRLNPNNIKAYYRGARAFLAVGRIAEADDACARGLTLDPSNNPLKAVARDIVKKAEETGVQARREAERVAKQKRREMLIKAALKAREIRTRTTAQPPEMEDAGIKLVPDPDDPASHLAFPTVLLYPVHLESDFIKAFNETDSLADHLGYVFPLPWDREGVYTLAGVECYMETVTGGMIKLGKKVPLLKALAGGKVEVVDEVVRIFVLPKAQAATWIEDFKRKRAAEKGS